jgi:hypothetical protein
LLNLLEKNVKVFHETIPFISDDCQPCNFCISPNDEFVPLLKAHVKASDDGALAKLPSKIPLFVDFVPIVILSSLHEDELLTFIKFIGYDLLYPIEPNFQVLDDLCEKLLVNIVTDPVIWVPKLL